jgi:hypothetical protein
MKKILFVVIAVGIGPVSASGCGSGSNGCPGITCTNCSGNGDCDITCATGQAQACESMANDGGAPSERCAWCRTGSL